ADRVTLTLLHTSDTHGHIASDIDAADTTGSGHRVSGFPLLKAQVQKIKLDALRQGNRALLLDAGDYFQGTAIVEETQGQVMIDLMNRMNYLAAGIGNHDLDYGLARLKDVLRSARHPILCCNVFETATGRLMASARSHIRVPYKGHQIAIIGALDPRTPDISMAENVAGLEFRDPVPILNELISRLRTQGVDVFVLLSHLGIEQDRQIAETVEGIDLILGGHSHTEMRELEYAGKNRVPIAHPGYDTRYVSRVDLHLLKGERPAVTFTPHFLSTAHLEEDAGMQTVIGEKLSSIAAKVKRHLGTCRATLVRGVIGGDSPEGNFVADAIREGTGAEIGLTNVGGVRFPIASGPVIWDQIFQLQPFNNLVEVVPMTGAQIVKILEEGLSVPFQQADAADKEYARKHFRLDISGLRRDFMAAFGYLVPSNLLVTFDPERPPMQRIVKLTLADDSPLDLKRVYKVAFNSYLSQGGDGYKYLKNWPGKINSRKLVRDLIVEKIERDQVIGPPAEQRMINLKLSCVPITGE
ncbi:MAG TPA: bifunctional UDP-sugar hydrolase/5'-nucleotidase, partial [Candidatus Ozemobacteraceae bacterium]|nr:bifunctional UDP-sugar hydrolase/5'-nucleotidase [Candidatus Ozemobacteraceae bacterium]